MIADIVAARAHGGDIGCPAAQILWHQALEHAFCHEIIGHFRKHLDVEPVQQAADLDPAARIIRQEPAVSQSEPARFIKIFGDHAGTGHRADLSFDKNRRAALGIKLQEGLAALPDLLFHKIGIEPELTQNKANKARMGTQGMMMKRRHDFDGSR